MKYPYQLRAAQSLHVTDYFQNPEMLHYHFHGTPLHPLQGNHTVLLSHKQKQI